MHSFKFTFMKITNFFDLDLDKTYTVADYLNLVV